MTEATSSQQRRRGYCPRVWTPMASGDGLLVRVHAATRWLDAALLEALLELACAHGNGMIEITRRANLQLRGVRPETLSALQQGLVALGLAAPEPERERVFVLHATPWLGLDPACAPLAPLLSALERLLIDSAATHALHPKLAIALSGPGAELAALAADLWIALDAREPTLAHLHVASSPRQRRYEGSCAVSEVPAWVAAWLTRLAQPAAPTAVASAAGQGMRVHEWLAQHGPASTSEPAEARDRHADAVPAQNPASAPSPERWLGLHTAPAPWFGALLPFGTGEPAQWRAVAGLAARHGDGTLRTHPERGLLLRGMAEDDATQLAQALTRAGLCVQPDAALTRTVACVGAPACASAQGETRSLARELAQLAAARLGPGGLLHVSGCEKSCAHSGPAAITLVHTAAGARLGFDCDTTGAAGAAVHDPGALRAALSASGREYATPALDDAAEPTPHDPAL